MICFVIYGVNIYVSKHKSNSFEKKNVWYSNDFCWFLLKFSIILADFLLPGSGWPKWNGSKRIRIRNTALQEDNVDAKEHLEAVAEDAAEVGESDKQTMTRTRSFSIVKPPPLKEQGCIKLPTNWYSSPPPFSLNLNFLFLFPFPLPHLLFFPTNSLNIIGKMILLNFYFFPYNILPHSHEIPFPSSQLDILPQQTR